MAEAVVLLREREKRESETSRFQRRADAINSSRRGLGYTSKPKYSENTVSNVISKLKSKKAIETDDLLMLMYALSEHEDNISLFFQVPGAMHGLIRELTGNHSRRQLIAAGCICNLALGPKKSCLSLSKASGTYLITYLQSHNRHFLELCAWTLGNLSASDNKVAKLLESQGLVDNLISLLSDNYDDNIIDSAAYALGHMIYSNFDFLKENQVHEITSRAISCNQNSDQVKWLLYLLSDKDAAETAFADNGYFETVIVKLYELVNIFNLFDLCAINCLIRTAANLCHLAQTNNNIIFQNEFVNFVKKVLLSDHVDIIKDTLWFLGNIYKNYSHWPPNAILFSEISSPLSCAIDRIK